jgi:hypothetical protein
VDDDAEPLGEMVEEIVIVVGGEDMACSTKTKGSELESSATTPE